MLFDIPDAVVGAICATLFAGFLTLLGLIISKEQKVSELRQAWIDALRTDLADYVSVVHSLRVVESAAHLKPDEIWEKSYPFKERVNALSARIKLRINPKEAASKNLMSKMADIEKSINDKRILSSSVPVWIEESVQTGAEILKSEWVRVKKGELYYRVCSILAIFMIIIPLVLGMWQLYASAKQRAADKFVTMQVHTGNFA